MSIAFSITTALGFLVIGICLLGVITESDPDDSFLGRAWRVVFACAWISFCVGLALALLGVGA